MTKTTAAPLGRERDPYEALMQEASAGIAAPAKRAPARKKRAVASEPYDELDMPVKKKRTPAKKKRAVASEPYDELDMPVKKKRAPSRKKTVPASNESDELDVFSRRKSAPSPKPVRKINADSVKSEYDELDVFPKKPARKSAPRQHRRPEASDPYDDLVERAEKSGGKKHHTQSDEFRVPRDKKGGGGRRGGGGYLAFVLSALIVICALVGGWQLLQFSNFIKMREAVDRTTFYDGTKVDGVDLSSMTLETAISHWESEIEPSYSARSADIDGAGSVTAAELGYSSDYREVLESAWGAQKSGTLEERYNGMLSAGAKSGGLHVTRTLYTDEAVAAYVKSAAANIDKESTDAAITGFDMDNFTFNVSEGQTGRVLDKDKLVSDIKSALDNGGGAVSMSIAEIAPKVKAADITASYGLRSSAVTNASSSSDNRLTNIRQAINSINGKVLKPGEEFSFNDTVGQRTAERGYKMAAAFSGGEVTEELGGGICQVSTTLFNAAVKSDLEITERHAHSMPVSYVDKGKDATVNWGSQDLRFKNNTDSPIYIVAQLTGEKRVKIGIFGKAIADGVYITVEADVTETMDYKTTYQTNSFLMPGETNVLQKGRTGYKAVAYKIYWNADGSQLKRETLCNSTYAKRDAIIEIPQ